MGQWLTFSSFDQWRAKEVWEHCENGKEQLSIHFMEIAAEIYSSVSRESEMTAQHKPPYLWSLRFAHPPPPLFPYKVD